MKNSESDANDAGSITGAIGENILYGLGTAAVTLGPLLIPGVTPYWLGVGLLGFASASYAVICMLAAIKCARKPPPRRPFRR